MPKRKAQTRAELLKTLCEQEQTIQEQQNQIRSLEDRTRAWIDDYDKVVRQYRKANLSLRTALRLIHFLTADSTTEDL